jgi:hypothetical protein
MAANAVKTRDSFAFRTTNDVCKMPAAIIALLRIVGGRMTIDATRVSHHGID